MTKKKFYGVTMAVAVLFSAVFFVCAYMQLICGGEYAEDAAAMTAESESFRALRGEITDREGNAIVSNRLCLSVQVESNISGEGLRLLYKTLNEKLPSDEIPPEGYIAAHDVGSKTASAIAELDIDGVSIIKDYVREYADYPRLSHTTGFVGLISAEEYDVLKNDGYLMNDFVGKDGIEKLSEDTLRGADGKKLSRRGETVFERKAQNGCDTVLTIDKRIQEVAEAELSRAVEEVEKERKCSSGGAVVVLDVNTGEVLVMASFPDYNISELSEQYTDLLKNESNPLLNRCISGVYEPGSTFKPLVALAALNEGVVTADEKIEDKGIYTYYSPTYTPTCHIWNEKGKTHGKLDVSDALAVSCNYYFYEAGRRLGIEKIKEYAKMFGFGENCGIELEGETKGTLASPDSKEEWYAGDTLQAAIGQSVNMFTPLKMASFVAALANGGGVYKPYIIKKIVSPDSKILLESAPELVNTVNIPKKYFDTVREGMRKCLLSGTAKASFEGKSFTAAGKTGSAQVPDGDENGLFIGFAPFDKPEIALSVVIEHGSGTYAADVAAKIMEKYLEVY